MNTLVRLRIGARLAVCFSTVVAMLVLLAVFAKVNLDSIGDRLTLIATERYPKVKLAIDIMEQINQQARSARNLLLLDTPQERTRHQEVIAESLRKMAEQSAQFETLLADAEGRQVFARLEAARQQYLRQFEPFLAEVLAGRIQEARGRLMGAVRTAQLDYMKSLAGVQNAVEQQMTDDVAEAKAQVLRAEWKMFAAVLAGALLAAWWGWIVTRSITQPLGESVTALRRVAEGDLTVDLRSDRRDELGELLRTLGETVVGLRRVVSEVRHGVDSVTTASSQIAAGNADLSNRTEQQAGSLQVTASSMEQLTSTVQQSAGVARQADQLSAAARAAAVQGGDSVSQVVATMERITQASQRIADIIGVVDGIAFQTNILALNAAVEAARAGEQGRGFAVVATEVRTLAQRSADAAKEIKVLIGASVERVEAGSRQVADAGAAMQEIVTQVSRVSDLIGELTSAASEQSAGIGQVNTAVAEMDRATQQNAALVEQSAAAAKSLEQQAERLAGVVRAFKLAPQA